MGHAYAARRVYVLNCHALHQIWLDKHVLRTFSERYCSLYGPVAPTRKEPLSRPMPRHLLAVPSGLYIGRRRILNWGNWFGINLAAAMAVASSGGFRKGELTLQGGVSHALTRISRASLFWITHGATARAPAASQLFALQPGDKAGLLAGPCKNGPGAPFRRPPALLRIRPGGRRQHGCPALYTRPPLPNTDRQSASALRCSHRHATSNQCGIGTSTVAPARCSWSSSVRRAPRSAPGTRFVWAWPAHCWRQVPQGLRF